jgi:hypothetical protein
MLPKMSVMMNLDMEGLSLDAGASEGVDRRPRQQS